MTPWVANRETGGQALFGRTILQIAPALDSGDEAKACVEIAAALAEAGARALVAGAPGSLASELQARGGVFLPFAAATNNPLKIMANRRELETLVLNEGVELIHVRAGASLGIASKIARRQRIPLVADFSPGRTEALDADSILVASKGELAEAMRLRPDAAAKLRQSLRGVDLRRFAAETVDSGRIKKLRDALGAPLHMRLVIGLDLPTEAQRLFLAAAGALKAKGFFANDAYETRLVWLESRDLATGFDAECAKAGLSADVARIVWDDRAAACLAAALVLAPSAAPRLCVEAQALGAPLALLLPPGAGAIDEVLPPDGGPAHRSGWIVPLNQPQTLARACEEAVRLGASARESLARKSRAHAAAFSVERMCSLALAAYTRHFQGDPT